MLRYDRSTWGAALSSGGFGDPLPKVGSVCESVCLPPVKGNKWAWRPVAAMCRVLTLAGGSATPNLGGFGSEYRENLLQFDRIAPVGAPGDSFGTSYPHWVMVHSPAIGFGQ